ncbi:MAG: hypothetical protein CMJ31_13205 [Phycisphaerae bacterium]|nr:hypothetical protein [Phycisphaerae bacterium]
MYEFPYKPGDRVRIVQQVPRLTGTLTTRVEGEIVTFGQSKTGSWFAHSKDKKLWLDRVEIRKDDGELVVVNLDQYSRVEPTSEPTKA